MTRVLRVHGEVRARALMVDIVEQTGLAAVTFQGSHAPHQTALLFALFMHVTSHMGGYLCTRKAQDRERGFL